MVSTSSDCTPIFQLQPDAALQSDNKALLHAISCFSVIDVVSKAKLNITKASLFQVNVYMKKQKTNE